MFNLKQLFNKDGKKHVFTCQCCGKIYNELPLCFGSERPDHYNTIPQNELLARVELTESLCAIDNYYFHRGRMTIPIVDYHENLVFNIWTSISEPNFEIRNAMWNDPARISNEPYFGYLNNVIPTYPDTYNLKTVAIENEVGLIPSIKVIDDDHPLFHDQQNGITFKDAQKKVQQILKWQHHK